MTGEPTRRALVGSVLAQTIAGVLVLLIGAAPAWLVGLLSAAQVSIWIFVAGIIAAGLLATLVYAPWRRAVWGNVAKWRPLTTVGRLERAKAAGRAEAEAERKQHKPSIRAQWFIYPVKNEAIKWELLNTAKGSTAKDVSLHVGNSDVRVGSALDWPEVTGGTSVGFTVGLTARSRQYGVAFTIAWTNEHGERLSTDYTYETGSF